MPIHNLKISKNTKLIKYTILNKESSLWYGGVTIKVESFDSVKVQSQKTYSPDKKPYIKNGNLGSLNSGLNCIKNSTSCLLNTGIECLMAFIEGKKNFYLQLRKNKNNKWSVSSSGDGVYRFDSEIEAFNFFEKQFDMYKKRINPF